MLWVSLGGSLDIGCMESEKVAGGNRSGSSTTINSSRMHRDIVVVLVFGRSKR